MQHGRGVALADFNRDGRTDIVYGNWNGPHRLYLQLNNNRKQRFKVGFFFIYKFKLADRFRSFQTWLLDSAHKYKCFIPVVI